MHHDTRTPAPIADSPEDVHTATVDLDGGTAVVEHTGDRVELTVRIGDRTEVVDMTGGSGRIDVPAGISAIVDPAGKLLKVEPHIEAWKATQEPRRGRRVTPVDPADPCLAGR